jgi:hypothetical protein
VIGERKTQFDEWVLNEQAGEKLMPMTAGRRDS